MLEVARTLASVMVLALPAAAQVTGTVVDAATGSGIEGVRLVVIDGDRRAVAAGSTTSGGVFRLEVEPQEGHQVVATMAGYHASEPVDASGSRAGALWIELIRLAEGEGYSTLPGPTRRGKVLGRVSAPGGPALRGVLVSVANGSALTDERGFFEVDISDTGRIPVRFEMIGRATVVDTVETQAEEGVFLTVAMAVEAIELEPITVTAVSRRRMLHLDDITRRVAMGIGDFVTTDEFSARGYPSFGQFLRGHPGIRIRGGVPVFRDAVSLSSGACSPTFYVDGVKLRSWGLASELSTLDLEMVELYRGPASTPAEYVDSDSRCGVVVLWTRRGVDLPLAEILDWRLGGGSPDPPDQNSPSAQLTRAAMEFGSLRD